MVNAPRLSPEVLYKTYLEEKDREVLGSLFRQFMPLVFGVCMKYIGEKHAAQDATMDVFEHLMSAEPKSEVRNFKAFLYVMTKNLCLMKQRGEKVQQVEITDRDMELATEVHPIDDPEAKEAQLKKCMEQLKDLQRACVELFYFKKQSYIEISSGQKMNLSAVKSHIQNGKRNLKICIEERA